MEVVALDYLIIITWLEMLINCVNFIYTLENITSIKHLGKHHMVNIYQHLMNEYIIK